MIQITRSLARQLRSVFRRLGRRSVVSRPVLSFDADGDRLRVRLHLAEVLAEFDVTSQLCSEALFVPLEALADFEGRDSNLVTLERSGASGVVARWPDGVVPKSRTYEVDGLDKLPAFPDLPTKMVRNDTALWQALGDAGQSVATDVTRYALDKIQLRGSHGAVVGTDGRQLLVQKGFEFPWKEDVLITPSPIFSGRDLSEGVPIAIGKTDTHVAVRADAWTIYLPIDKNSRFPQADQVVPALGAGASRCRLDPADAKFLAETLPRLPRDADDDTAPVTLDLNGQVWVRAQAPEKGGVTELALARSTASGPPVRCCVSGRLLARALALRLTDIGITRPDRPVVFHDDRRQLVIMPLDQKAALPPSDNALSIASVDGPSTVSTATPTPERNIDMKNPLVSNFPNGNGNGISASQHSANGAAGDKVPAPGAGIGGLIAEAEALKTLLHDAYGRSHQLLVAVKRHRKQAQTVQATLASLRQLHTIEA